MTDFEGHVLRDLGVLKAQMDQLMGVGQPGRLHSLEHRVESNEKTVQRVKGLAGAFGGLLTVVHLVIAFLGGRHL
jgi:hypothetical protein